MIIIYTSLKSVHGTFQLLIEVIRSKFQHFFSIKLMHAKLGKKIKKNEVCFFFLKESACDVKMLSIERI